MFAEDSTYEEDILVAVNDHWVVLVVPTFAYILFLLSMVGLWYLIKAVYEIQLLCEILKFLLVLLSTAATHVYLIYLIKWELSSVILTNKRIINLEIVPYLTNTVSFINVSEIHEVEKKKDGLLPNLLDYGDLQVNVAALPVPMNLKYVPRPTQFVHLIQLLQSGQELDSETLTNVFSRKYLSFVS